MIDFLEGWIYWKDGYKNQLLSTHWFNIGQRVNDNLYPPDKQDEDGDWYWEASPFLCLYPDGMILQAVGYAWDGCSGPAIDSDTNQVPGLEHDGGYQLIRAGILPEDPWRKIFDERLRDGILERAEKLPWYKRGIAKFRAHYFYRVVRLAGYISATEKKDIHRAE